jgi:hypothetical protein
MTTEVIELEATCLDTKSPGVRTVLHMSPAVMAAAVLSAQKCGLTLREWFNRAVASLIADDHPEGAAPWSVQSAELFAQVVNNSPESLHGRWSLLYERALLARTLRHEPSVTVGQIEDGELPGAPYIAPAMLWKPWPRLVATVFLPLIPRASPWSSDAWSRRKLHTETNPLLRRNCARRRRSRRGNSGHRHPSRTERRRAAERTFHCASAHHA